MSRFIKSNAALAAALTSVIGLAAGTLPASAQTPAAEIYAQNCASCHGPDRLGQTGPALIPESLVRLKKEAAARTIAEGRAATQMPAFKDQLAPEAIASLADYIYAPLAVPPKWDAADIEATRVVVNTAPPLTKPQYPSDPLNLFVVVETGDHHATILDGDTFTPITRFATRFALHGGPKFSPDGRFVTFMSRDGWVTKYDLWSLKVIAEVRAGLNSPGGPADRQQDDAQDADRLRIGRSKPNQNHASTGSRTTVMIAAGHRRVPHEPGRPRSRHSDEEEGHQRVRRRCGAHRLHHGPAYISNRPKNDGSRPRRRR